VTELTGSAGELCGRLLDVVDHPGPQLRAVVTTLLIKALDVPDQEGRLFEALVASDDAAAMIDPAAAAGEHLELRHRLAARLGELAAVQGEAATVRTLRDHLVDLVHRWAARAVDDVDNRRRAERFLAWAERPDQLRAAQRRGLFAGMDVEELRRLAADRVAGPVTPETALELWAQVDRWEAVVDESIGDTAIAAWSDGGR
jgi:hypothetical protein